MNTTDIKVASKIDNFIIVINQGSVNNIRQFMRFMVYEDGDEIFDPTTGESLGILEIPKGFFKVQHIQEKISILVSELKKEGKIFNTISLFNELDVQRELLNSIKVGDKVKIINSI